MQHRIQLQVAPPELADSNIQYVQLDADKNNHYTWKIYDRIWRVIEEYNQPLSTIIPQILTQTPSEPDTSSINTPKLYIVPHLPDATPIHLFSNKPTKNPHHHPINIGIIQARKNNNDTKITLQINEYNHNMPVYDLSSIYHYPPNDAATYLCHHIPMEHIIHETTTRFTQATLYPSMLYHHHPALHQDPLRIETTLANNKGLLWTDIEPHSSKLIPQNIDYAYISLKGNTIQDRYTFDPNTPYHDIEDIWKEKLINHYFSHHTIQQYSQHTQMQLRRIFAEHINDIARDIYDSAIDHRAARLQTILLDFPRIIPNPKETT